MKNIYPKLAWSGIKNNRRLYVPYILTCIGMIMMFYIMEFLTLNPAIKNMPDLVQKFHDVKHHNHSYTCSICKEHTDACYFLFRSMQALDKYFSFLSDHLSQS